ncbi:MAG: hypothetical protein J6X85_00150 [Ruminococcus sp.]|nr:hypothetical protein [Ruminococcus sp.]
MYNKIMETGTAPENKDSELKGNDLMKKLTSNVIRFFYYLSAVIMVPAAIVEIYEIISGRAAVDPCLRNMTDGIFWSAFALYHLCNWYIRKNRNNTIGTF